MAEPSGSARSVRLITDLSIGISDRQGAATAHLTSDSGELCLDIDRPDVLLRALPPTMLASGVRARLAATDVFPNYSMVLRSGGRELGRAHLSLAGRLRVRPSRAGARLLVKLLLSKPRTPPGKIVRLLAPTVNLDVVSRLRRVGFSTDQGATDGHHHHP